MSISQRFVRGQLFVWLTICWLSTPPLAQSADVVHYDAVVTEKRHFDANNFTQGLEIDDGILWVSSGLYGKSAVRCYRWPDQALISETRLNERLFAEGLTLSDEQVFVLTWRARLLLILNRNTLQPEGSATLPGEGWGIAHHQGTLYYSDGSASLRVINLGDRSNQILQVTLNGQPVSRLNELEWVDGEIWANVWMSNDILRIDPNSGEVRGVIHVGQLLTAKEQRKADVLNGIARDPQTGRIWITGKHWPWLFSIKLEERR